MVRSYLLSFLAARVAQLGPEFDQKHPGAWLVWEPGVWHAPEAGAAAERKTLVGFKLPSAPVGTDALCFQLALEDWEGGVKVGRDERCDVVINDATVSREHLVLTRSAHERWLAEPSSQRPVKHGGALLPQGHATPLASGDRLELGAVTCSFYDSTGFLERVARDKKK